MNTQLPEKITILDQIYGILNDLTRRLGNTNWGSAAFDIEVGKTRHDIYKLVQEKESDAKSHWIAEVRRDILAQAADDQSNLLEVDAISPHLTKGECMEIAHNSALESVLHLPSLTTIPPQGKRNDQK